MKSSITMALSSSIFSSSSYPPTYLMFFIKEKHR